VTRVVEPPEAPLRLAYSNLACPEWSFERCVEAVGEYGFDGLEVRLFDGEVVSAGLSEASRRRADACLRESGVPVAALDTSLTVTTEDRGRFLAELEDLAGLAERWGAPLLRLFGGRLPASSPAREEALEAAAALLRSAAAVAERHRVRLAVETHDDFSSAYTLAELLDRAGGVAGAVYDSHHPHRMGESPADVLAALGPRVWHVQVKDARRRPAPPSAPAEGATDPAAGLGQDEWELVDLGQGEVPVRVLLGLLKATGYRGWVSLEYEKKWHPELAAPEEALPRQRQRLAEWLQALP